MITPEDIRRDVTALPEVEEKPHFGRPGFRVRDKLMVSLHEDQGDAYAILGVDQAEPEVLAAQDPDTFAEVWRNGGKIFVGLRTDLSVITPDRFRDLLELAWRNKAPKRVIAAFDQR